MSSPRLAIPLNDSSSRHKLGRGFGVVAWLALAITFGFILDRAIHYRRANTQWPADASIELRLIKTPRLEKLINTGFNDTQTLPGTPWNLPETLSWSKREFTLYANGETILGLSVDGQIPEQTLVALEDWGWKTQKIGRSQVLIFKQTSSNQLKKPMRKPNFWLMWPFFDGTASIDTQTGHVAQAPFRLNSPHDLDLFINTQSFIPSSHSTLPSDTNLLSSLSLPPDWQTALLPSAIPATFPGFQELKTQISDKQLDILIGQDQQGIAFVITAPSPGLNLEQLGAIAKEGAAIQNLSTTALPNNEDGREATEIRSNGNVNVSLTNNGDLLVAVAKTADNRLFRLTQSQEQLIMSNREPTIGVESAQYSQACLAKPQGFLQSATLATISPEMNQINGLDLMSKLAQADEFAFKKHKLRICW